MRYFKLQAHASFDSESDTEYLAEVKARTLALPFRLARTVSRCMGVPVWLVEIEGRGKIDKEISRTITVWGKPK